MPRRIRNGGTSRGARPAGISRPHGRMMRPSPRNDVLLDRLKGFIADLPTPFDVAGDVDWKAFGVLFERQIAHGATAVVVGETSGEASTLSRAERAAIIRAAIDLARDRVAVIAGAGSNSTDQAIELTALAKSQGADAALSVVPYYNKPMQPGILKHFRSIAATTNLPILLHDAPSRSAVSLADETAILLAEHRGIVGLCDAAGSVTRLSRLRRALPPGFRLFCGSQGDAWSYLASGGDGCISGLACLSPDLCREVQRACAGGTL